jgi:hypothetical protein
MKKSISILAIAMTFFATTLTAQNANDLPIGKAEKDQVTESKNMSKPHDLTEVQRPCANCTNCGKCIAQEGKQGLNKKNFAQGNKRFNRRADFARNGRQDFRKNGFAMDRRHKMQGKGFAMAGRKGMNRNGMRPGERQNFRNNRYAFAGKQGFGRGRNLEMMPMMNPEKRIDMQVEKLKVQLGLSSDQTAKVKDIRMKQSKKEIARYKKFEKKLNAQFAKRHGNLDEIKSVLTDEQIKKLDDIKSHGPYTRGNQRFGNEHQFQK